MAGQPQLISNAKGSFHAVLKPGTYGVIHLGGIKRNCNRATHPWKRDNHLDLVSDIQNNALRPVKGPVVTRTRFPAWRYICGSAPLKLTAIITRSIWESGLNAGTPLYETRDATPGIARTRRR